MSETITPELARARATLIAMGAAADLRDWQTVAACLGESITVDYTSLFGGDPQTMPGDALVEQWRAMLPGFDGTRHMIGEPDLSLENGRVVGEAPVVGTHMLDGESWIVSGRYVVEFASDGDRSRITKLTLKIEDESGDRGLTEKAKQRAKISQ